MVLIYETQDFVIEAVDKPHITRSDGGHIIIKPKIRLSYRQQLTPKQAIEMMKLIIITGEAMTSVMNRRGVDIGRINYQDNGNWSVFKPEGPYLHVHLYGRAKSAKVQKYGDACYFPHKEEKPEFYENNEPLNEGDVEEIHKEIEILLNQEKYKDSSWGLS